MRDEAEVVQCPSKYFNLLNLFKKVIVSVVEHIFSSLCVTYFVPTINV